MVVALTALDALRLAVVQVADMSKLLVKSIIGHKTPQHGRRVGSVLVGTDTCVAVCAGMQAEMISDSLQVVGLEGAHL